MLINVKEVARMLSCSVRTVYRLADSGRMPRPVKVSGMVRWVRENKVKLPMHAKKQWPGLRPCMTDGSGTSRQSRVAPFLRKCLQGISKRDITWCENMA